MIIPTGFAQVNHIYTGPSFPTGAQWVLGLDVSGFSGSPADAGTAILAAYETANFDAQTAAGCDLTGLLVKFGPNNTGPSALTSANVGGANSGDCNPNAAALVHKNTADGGHAGRGRTYYPGVTESNMSDAGVLASLYRIALETCFETYLEELDTALLPAFLLHGEGSPISAPSQIVSMTVDATSATQRRRLRR